MSEQMYTAQEVASFIQALLKIDDSDDTVWNLKVSWMPPGGMVPQEVIDVELIDALKEEVKKKEETQGDSIKTGQTQAEDR